MLLTSIIKYLSLIATNSYLLAPQTSPLGGLGGNPKLKLLGSSATSPTFYKDTDPIVFSEIAEFAMSLATPGKGQEPFIGFPHLQPYRLIRAVTLAELGHVQLATRFVSIDLFVDYLLIPL